MVKVGDRFTSAFDLLVTIREVDNQQVKYTCHFHYSRQRYVYVAGADRVVVWIEKGFWKPYFPAV